MNENQDIYSYNVRIGAASILTGRKIYSPKDENELVVTIRDVGKRYTYGCKRIYILHDVYMNVYKGTIYCLIGPSGCGKSTLLSCIVNTISVNKGTIKVLGSEAGSKPNCRHIGYMPPDVSLYEGLTIKETALIFGKIAQMNRNEVLNRLRFFTAYFELSDWNKQLRYLSFSEKRRVSFTMAVIHDPEFIIMDEPTIGADSVVRDSMWKYLHAMITIQKTVLITTHYLEESANATVIGIMDKGKLLEQGRPSSLLKAYTAKSIKEVYIKVCREEVERKYCGYDIEIIPSITNLSRRRTNTALVKKGMSNVIQRYIKKFKCSCRCSAVMATNLIVILEYMVMVMFRDKYLLFFSILFPIIVALMLGLMQISSDLPVFGVVNDESGFKGEEYKSCRISNSSCDNNDYGCWLVDVFSEKATIKPIRELSVAKTRLEQSKINAVVHIRTDFTTEFLLAYSKDNPPIDSRKFLINIWLDNTDASYNMLSSKASSNVYDDFYNRVLTLCQSEKDLVNMVQLLHINDITVQKKGVGYNRYHLFPGVLLCLVYLMHLGMATNTFTCDNQKDGHFARLYAAGVYPFQIVLICTILLGILAFLQVLLLLALISLISGLSGSFIVMVIITTLVAMSATSMGMFLSVCCNKDSTSVRAIMMFGFVAILWSGVIHPVDKFPLPFSMIGWIMPLETPIMAMSSVRAQDWHEDFGIEVISSVLVSLGWIVVCDIGNVLVLKAKK